MTIKENDKSEAAEEMTRETKNEVIRMNEDDILSGLILAAGYHEDKEDFTTIEIVRGGRTAIVFRIHPLGEQEILECRKANTKYKRNKQTNARIAEETDSARYRSQMIYTATVPEDREKIWDSRNAWEKLHVLNGIDLVEVVLKAGEKSQIIDKIEEISGYNSLEDTAKN